MTGIVEIHVPLAPPQTGEEPFGWIDHVENVLARMEAGGEIEVYDDGEQHGDVYIFFIAGADEARLLVAASRVATLDGIPAGAFAMVTDDQAPEFGMGRRVELPVP